MNLVDILQMTKEDSRVYLEKIRWPKGVVCPRCEGKRVVALNGKSTRAGVYKCRNCANLLLSAQFTVTVGTIFEDSHVPLNKWIAAFYLMCESKKGVSANQLHRTLGLNYKTAWYMCHRVRLAMRSGSIEKLKGIVEADETFIGGKDKTGHKRLAKAAVLVLIQRDGQARTKHVKRLNSQTMIAYLKQNMDPDCQLMTDQAHYYKGVGKMFKSHEAVNHSKFEYARGNVNSNTAESYFALLKRGVYGTFHHVSKKHLFRYCDEFNFRWNHRKLEGGGSLDLALKGGEGRRLFYRRPLPRV